jgi:hypothetical protein
MLFWPTVAIPRLCVCAIFLPKCRITIILTLLCFACKSTFCTQAKGDYNTNCYMEFLDPRYQRSHHIRLVIGYILVGIALVLTTLILLYRAYGYGLTKDGEVIQNGLVFLSSRPEGAAIYVDGAKRPEQTNTRILMPSGQYTFEIRRDGYRTWKRAIAVEGGSVMRYDYPALFPTKLNTESIAKYDVQPPLSTQSPDRRWYLVQQPSELASFALYDLNNPDEASTTIAVPAERIALKTGLHQWKALEWSNDNRHVLLQHTTNTDGRITSEYVLFDRDSPAETRNITADLGVNPDTLTLRDKKFDQYYLYDKTDQVLSTASLDEPTPKALLQKVLAYKSHGENRLLYATTQGAEAGKVALKLREGTNTYTIRQVAASEAYMLDIASYSGDWYVVVGSPSENRTYVYQNPVDSLRRTPKQALVPVQVLKTANPTYVSFSDNARFIMTQSGQQIAVYDAENDRGYAYALPQPIDSPQQHVTWMDGHRMMAVVDGKVRVFDFDNANSETLSAANPSFVPVFDRDYEFLYTIANQSLKTDDGTEATQYTLNGTALRTPADQ